MESLVTQGEIARKEGVPRETENHLMTGKRRKTSENAEKRRKTPENAGKRRKICTCKTKNIVLEGRWNCPH